MQAWQRMTERIGFWVDLNDAYVTYHQSYVESVWWSLKQLFDRGLLYQGYKIVWWWAQGGTALSAGEVGQGYREVADPSVYVKFPLVSDERTKALGLDGASLLVWTTTPWTLPSNQFAAVHPDLEYAVVVDHDDTTGTTEKLIIASVLVETIEVKVKRELKVERTVVGRKLLDLRYRQPFDYFYRNDSDGLGAPVGQEGPRRQEVAKKYLEDHDDWKHGKDVEGWNVNWKIVEGDFVTVDSGTGVVHIAPAFGEDDFRVLRREQEKVTAGYRAMLLNPVLPNGTFSAAIPDYEGRWVKDCDKDIIHDLKNRGLLFHREEYRHEYPFCWRAEEDPLIQYPRRSWFIKTSEFKDQMLENNRRINWLPEHIKDGRFGNFLETNVDWALSRERFWGTPLPIWVCEKTGKMEAVASYDELLAKSGVLGTEYWVQAKAKNPNLADDLCVHKPYIDEVTYDSPFEKGARMKRVTEVIDCWYDSGAMPFAQWAYQGEGQKVEESKSRKDSAKSNAGSSALGLLDPSTAAAAAAQIFHEQFPADFISEALDQTRGWFYSQLAISTLLFSKGPKVEGSKSRKDSVSEPAGSSTLGLLDSSTPSPVFTAQYPHPFRNCIVLGLMLGEDGQKMSKSKRNYREPGEIFDKYGADALRWYFFATQPPWTTIRYSERAIRDSIPEFLLRLWNVYSFFVIYANIDGFEPLAEIGQRVEKSKGQKDSSTLGLLDSSTLATAKSYRPIKDRSELDRWILSELNLTAKAVVERMDAYDNYGAAQRIIAFVDALSNWYVRRSRDRFWSEDRRDPDKLDAYWTLYEALLTTAKIIAPFVPFLAETIWRNLSGSARQEGRKVEKSKSRKESATSPAGSSTFGNLDSSTLSALESVHLTDFPTGDEAAIDENLSAQMNLVREIASLGLAARMGAKLKVRQPMQKVEVILADRNQQAWLEGHVELLKKELNVKQVEFTQQADHYITYTVLPDLKRLGPRLGKKLPLVKNALAKADAGKLLAEMETAGNVALKLDDGSSESLDRDDLQVRLQAKSGWAAAQGKDCVVVLSTAVTTDLLIEGVARELVHAVQSRRRDCSCEYTDRIEVGIVTDSAEIRRAVEQFNDYIRGETLAIRLKLGPIDGVEPVEVKIGDDTLQLYVRTVKK
jgi:isoleucyl-tRNA synthetase